MFLEELKKIWKPLMLLPLALITIFFWWFRLEFNIEFFPNGTPNKQLFEYEKEWINTYGTTLEPDEAEEIRSMLRELYDEATEYMQGEELFKQYNLNTYEEYINFYDEFMDYYDVETATEEEEKQYSDLEEMRNYIVWNNANDVHWRIQAVELVLMDYDYYTEYGNDVFKSWFDEDYQSGGTAYEYAVDQFMDDDQTWSNIMNNELPSTTSEYAGYLLDLILLSIILLVGPFLVGDRISRMRAMQWSSRTGRNITFIQLSTVMFCAFLVTTVYLIVFGTIFATNDIGEFWNCRMFSFIGGIPCWSNFTYGTWCIILAAMCYLISFGVAGIMFFLSCFCENYISMLLKAVPLYIVLYILCGQIFPHAFYFVNSLYLIFKIPYIELIVALLIFMVGVFLAFAACHRQQKSELLTD